MKEKTSILNAFEKYEEKLIDQLLAEQMDKDNRKIIVLDDDPTGVQTVHDVSVYTDWSTESIMKGFRESNKLFYILTNSRSFTHEVSTKVHIEIAKKVDAVGKSLRRDYIIISRGDSTLRGHYPLETEILKEVIEANNDCQIDGEVICPFFKEGGRYTLNNIHYIKDGEELIPVGESEFAKDKTFGYHSSNLCEYVEEKTNGKYKASDVVCIDIETLREQDIEKIVSQLGDVSNFGKVVVNAIDEYDLKVFCIALYKALEQGKHFLFRVAAPFVKVIGNIQSKPLLIREHMMNGEVKNGGVIIVGSHTEKTTKQLQELRGLNDVVTIEMNSDLVLEEGELEKEVKSINRQTEKLIEEEKTVVIFTKRKLLTVEGDTKEEALIRSVKISDAVQSLIANLEVTPSFVVAKGGITSSDIGTKALRVKKAVVLGQIRPGIPVWQTGAESKFPGIPYIIFPGNVGEASTLREVVEALIK